MPDVNAAAIAERLLAEGAYIVKIGHETGWLDEEVVAFARLHGYGFAGGFPIRDGKPVPVKQAQPAPSLSRAHTPPRPLGVERNAERSTPPEPGPDTAEQRVRATVRDLIFTAKASRFGATRRLAERAERIIDDLHERVLAEQKAAADKAEAVRKREAAKAEVVRLKAELAAAVERAKPPTHASRRGKPRVDVRNQAIRAWAKDRNIKIAARGVIPSVVVAAYDEAHPSQVGT